MSKPATLRDMSPSMAWRLNVQPLITPPMKEQESSQFGQDILSESAQHNCVAVRLQRRTSPIVVLLTAAMIPTLAFVSHLLAIS
jgi:hypothetical protein